MMPGYYGFGYGGMGLGMILFWGLIIAVIVLLVRGFGTRSGVSGKNTPDKTAMDILRQRYARGEIDKAELEEKRRDLSAV